MTFSVATFAVAFCLHYLLTDTPCTSDLLRFPLSFCQSQTAPAGMVVETTTVSAASAECVTVDGGTNQASPGRKDLCQGALAPQIVPRMAPHALLSPPSLGDHPGDSSGRVAEGRGDGESGVDFNPGCWSPRDRNTEDRHEGGLGWHNVDRGGEDVVCVAKGHKGLQHLSEAAPEHAREVQEWAPEKEEIEKVVNDAVPLDASSVKFGGFDGIAFDK